MNNQDSTVMELAETLIHSTRMPKLQEDEMAYLLLDVASNMVNIKQEDLTVIVGVAAQLLKVSIAQQARDVINTASRH